VWPDLGVAPTDFYYADLTGNWDLDDDGVYGEWGDDFGGGGVDVYAEVWVGRIPYYHAHGGVEALDAILTKIINYQGEDPNDIAWRKNSLLPVADPQPTLDDYKSAERIKDDVLVPENWGYHRAYAEDPNLDPPAETRWCSNDPNVVENVPALWRWPDDPNDPEDPNENGPFGLVVWFTHGSALSATDVIKACPEGRCLPDQVAGLNDSYPAFTYQASCNNAWPEDWGNLAYQLLRNGAACTVGATRTAWAGVSPSLTQLGYAYTGAWCPTR